MFFAETVFFEGLRREGDIPTPRMVVFYSRGVADEAVKLLTQNNMIGQGKYEQRSVLVYENFDEYYHPWGSVLGLLSEILPTVRLCYWLIVGGVDAGGRHFLAKSLFFISEHVAEQAYHNMVRPQNGELNIASCEIYYSASQLVEDLLAGKDCGV